MTKILFICHGNICRSPTAEYVMKDLVRRGGLEEQFEIASAASHRDELGNPVYAPSRRVLSEHGIDCSDKRARLLMRNDYAYYDLLIGMDGENLHDMRRLFGGDPQGKLHMMMEYAGRPQDDVADPWYTRDFMRTWQDINQACQGLLESLCGLVTIDFSGCKDIPALYRRLSEKLSWQDWYGTNLDALYDILTGFPQKAKGYILLPPDKDMPEDTRNYANRIAELFREAGY